MKKVTFNDAERFWSKVDAKEDDECWNWMAKSKARGYGTIQIGGRKGKRMLAHRYAYEFLNGKIPDGEGYHGAVIRHTCDNRLCCNPEHLVLGTQADNVRDMDIKGRRKTVCSRGEKHHMTKYSEDDIRFIRTSELSNAGLGRMFNVNRSTIRAIRLRKTWGHIE